jgi:hypothetical protein
MNKVNFKKVVFGLSLGTVMALGSMSSAFAADNNLPTTQATKVHLLPTNPILGNVGTSAPLIQNGANGGRVLSNVGTTAPLIQNGANGGRVLGNVGTPAPLIQNGANGGRVLGNVGTPAPLIQNGANGGRVLGNVGTPAPLIQNGANGGRVLGNVGTSSKCDQNQKPNQIKHRSQLLPQEQAKKIALKQHKGTVKDTKLNKENGKDVYIIVIHGQDGKDYTVKMNADTESVN